MVRLFGMFMKSVCKRCGVVHQQKPVDPEKIAMKLAQELADDIDKHIMEKLIGKNRIRHGDGKPNHTPNA